MKFKVSFVPFRDWIEQTELKLIDYVLKGFDTSILDGAIKVRGGRQELAKPVSVSKYSFILSMSLVFCIVKRLPDNYPTTWEAISETVQ